MVTVVVVINIAIALFLLYLARRIWLIRQRLIRLTNTLIAAELTTHSVLSVAPDAISRGEQGIHRLRQGNEPLQLQLQRVRQVVSLLVLGQQGWRRFSRPLPTLKPPLAKYR